MKTFATVTAAIGLVGAIVAASPASAGVGQCFDAYGRPVVAPHSTDNPPYNLICQVYSQGGQCTSVHPEWAANNCGYAPRRTYNRGYYYQDAPHYRSRYYDYNPRGLPPERQREIRRYERVNPGAKYEVHPDPTHPIIPDRGPPSSAR